MSKKQFSDRFDPNQELPMDGRNVFIHLATPTKNTWLRGWFDPRSGWRLGEYEPLPHEWHVIEWSENEPVVPF